MDETGIALNQVIVYLDLDPTVLATVRALLDGGADIDATDDQGRTALHYAASLIQPALVSELLTRGADVAVPDNAGATAYDLAQASTTAGRGLFLVRVEATLKLLEAAAAAP